MEAQLYQEIARKRTIKIQRKSFRIVFNYTITLYYYHYVFPPRKQERPLSEPGTPVTKGALEVHLFCPPSPSPPLCPPNFSPIPLNYKSNSGEEDPVLRAKPISL